MRGPASVHEDGDGDGATTSRLFGRYPKDNAKKLALVVFFWLALAGIALLALGRFPSSWLQWVLLLLLGPIAVVLFSAAGEFGMEGLSSLAKKLGLGPVGRVALLLLILVPTCAVAAFFGVK